MGMMAAKKGDKVVGIDTHIVLVPSASGSTPTPLPHPFAGKLDGALSSDVKIEGKPAATVDSTATNSPSHIPTSPGVSFQKSPANKGTVQAGSQTVKISGKAAARMADPVKTCNDPSDAPVGKIVVASSTVLIG